MNMLAGGSVGSFDQKLGYLPILDSSWKDSFGESAAYVGSAAEGH